MRAQPHAKSVTVVRHIFLPGQVASLRRGKDAASGENSFSGFCKEAKAGGGGDFTRHRFSALPLKEKFEL
jgi:hypothetical protein